MIAAQKYLGNKRPLHTTLIKPNSPALEGNNSPDLIYQTTQIVDIKMLQGILIQARGHIKKVDERNEYLGHPFCFIWDNKQVQDVNTFDQNQKQKIWKTDLKSPSYC